MGTGLYIDRLARVVPPRAGAANGYGAVRVVACNASTTAVELDSDIFQMTPPASTAGVPGSIGRALVRFQGDASNDLYLNFGATNAVAANSAATTGNTRCSRIPANQDRDFELDPTVDKFFQATTANGAGLTATLRYWIVSQPSQNNPADG